MTPVRYYTDVVLVVPNPGQVGESELGSPSTPLLDSDRFT